jgi:hypothetical protein
MARTFVLPGGWGLSKSDVLVYDCGPLGIENMLLSDPSVSLLSYLFH